MIARRLSAVLVALVVALASWSVVGADPRATVRNPLPFEHAEHAEIFAKANITCVNCHPVGLAVRTPDGPRAPAERLEAPRSSCHGCHLEDWRKAPRSAPSACTTCHSDLGPLIPANHGPGWIERHAGDARAFSATCSDCHEASTCFACHEQRGAMATDPHPPGFSTTHGIEARVDPRSCSSCHAAQTCESCHARGGTPW